MISELLSFYDDNLLQNSSFNSGNLNILETQNSLQQTTQLQQDDYYNRRSCIRGNILQDTNMASRSFVFASTNFLFNQCKPSSNGNTNENISEFRFDSPFNSTPIDYSMDPLPS
ncbi:Hypothetical predicted protein [Olea europaea subsp. europaea]|uniref:Uncharacterized protein n=1 Tax=Olea europaea subsp. europaea TaxID=158383 RepID=A0A8S0RC38_OLEEU|nr:Hypothetical predicted protein [Olea europaea subsp. europaea]